ncbi:uncharacterized protein LOC129294428 isoform X2 [Prosopis cineraria]|uniref:uncharacterized protein LOC129294428 isoform X2 n=1 Tax=Prosopis cineraria TaxID=364024 RepID=UPI0024100E90|nr:uncharacterized protein LOC129294428 isoform X2 [Prosopis cineraria]
MEGTASVATATATRGSSFQMPLSRQEWRAVAEHHLAGNPDDKELEQRKLGQSDERTIYEVQQGRQPLDVDFCSVTVDGTLDNDILQQRIQDVARQREELERIEVEIRAQMIARTEIIEMQNSFDAQLKEHSNAACKLQEQLRERDHTVHELERKIEEKDRELHAIKLDNEAAWAKQDLLREQNKELATFRMERDHSEAERAQHLQQIHDLQELIQEKERQLMELKEQHRVAQETIMYKDEQLREAHAWIARVREVDAYQATTNQTLQAELRERTEQYNQLWMGYQRQFADMERLHLHAIQQLQLELVEARERSGTYNEKNSSQFGQDNGSQFGVNGSSTSNGNNGLLANENSDSVQPFASNGNAAIQIDHVPGVPIAPSSLLGMPSYLPPGQVAALHPFVMHQQGVSHSVAPQVGHFHSVQAISPMQQWQNQQDVSEGSQASIQDDPASSQADQNSMRLDAKYNYENSIDGQVLGNYLDVHIRQGEEPQTMITSSTGETQSVDKDQPVASQPDQSLNQISSHFHSALRLNSFEQNREIKDENAVASTNCGPGDQFLMAEQTNSAATASSHTVHLVKQSEMATNVSADSVLPEAYVPTGQTNLTEIIRTSEVTLLDERTLLACIVRTIPAGGRIRISSTLPNRLGKMLAPLHWHDYKRKYGKLDDFVASHPELFMIEGDYIQLREGAQKMVVATAAVAKVAAAAASSSSSYSSYLPTVAVTPMAQSHRLKKGPSIDPKNVKTDISVKDFAVISSNPTDEALKHQQTNGVSVSVTRGLANAKILSKSKDSQNVDGPENWSVLSSVLSTGGNRGSLDRSSVSSAQNSGPPNGRTTMFSAVKQQTRKQSGKLSF